MSASGRKPVAEAERHQVDHEALLGGRRHEVALDDVLELMDVERGGVDDFVRHRPQGREFLPLQRNPLHHGPPLAERVRPPRLAEPPQQRLVAGVQKEDLDPVPLLLEFGEDLRILLQEVPFPQIHDEGHLADLAGGVGLDLEKFRQQDDGQVVDAEKSHVLQRPKGRALAGAGHAGDDDDSQVLHSAPPGQAQALEQWKTREQPDRKHLLMGVRRAAGF